MAGMKSIDEARNVLEDAALTAMTTETVEGLHGTSKALMPDTPIPAGFFLVTDGRPPGTRRPKAYMKYRAPACQCLKTWSASPTSK
jgi:hypothetical protein